MKRLKFSLVLILILFMVNSAYSQYFSTGADPANIKWSQINTTNFQLIFPEEYESKAQRFAAILEEVYKFGYQSLGKAPRKISVIMHTHTVSSNGMVAWTPKRMELYPTPHQKIYAQDWLEELAIHEFRHVVQMDKIETELPFIFKLLFGEQAAAATVAAYVPFWLLEGDAVISETVLSNTGRGRNPYFLMENKAQLMEKGLYSYDKATLGSYKNFVPNRYKFGWWMLGGIRAKYGDKIWADILDNVANKPLSINPVNKILKQETGKTKENLYLELFSDYQESWNKELEKQATTIPENLTSAPKIYTNYLYPQVTAHGDIIAYKQSRDDIGRIVDLIDGQEVVLFTPGTMLEESFSAIDGKVIWSERRAHVRWDHADRSVIILLDPSIPRKQEFKYDDNLFAPRISPTGNRFAAVRVNTTNDYSLGVYNLNDGTLIRSYKLDSNDFIFSPCWDSDAKQIFCIGMSEHGKYIAAIDLQSGEVSRLTEPSYFDIRNLTYYDHSLIYTSAESGVDNIWQLDLNSKISTQKTSVAFGADYGSCDGKFLYFSNYTADGYQLAKLPVEKWLDEASTGKRMISNKLADSLSKQEGKVLNFSNLVDSSFQIKPYRKLTHLFNFHSWAPVYINTTAYEVRPGVSFFSQNKLGTSTANLGYDYDWTERAGKYRASFEYSGLFPVIRAEVNYGKRKSTYGVIQQNGDTIYHPFSWNELSYELAAKLPLTFSSGKYVQFLQPQIEYARTQLSHDATTPDEFYHGFYHGITYQLYFQNVLRRAELDVAPRWGQAVDFVFKQNPTGGTKVGDLKAVQTYLYFPGILKNQAIRIYNGYQEKLTDKSLSFSDVVRFPRGIQRISNTRLYTFTADYMLPLAYPDFSFGRFFYLKRLRASLFYDFSSLKGKTYNEDNSVHSIYEKYLSSFGVEMTGDGHFLRLPAPLSIGIRSIYLPDFREMRFELLFSISFDSI